MLLYEQFLRVTCWLRFRFRLIFCVFTNLFSFLCVSHIPYWLCKFGCHCSAVDCLRRLICEITYYVLSGTLNSNHSSLTIQNYTVIIIMFTW